MSRVTSKGQITIPRDIRNKFSLLPGTEVDVIAVDNQVLIVKSRPENQFLKWLGRGKHYSKQEIDLNIDQLRGRTDE